MRVRPLLALLAALLLAVAFGACGDPEEENADDTEIENPDATTTTHGELAGSDADNFPVCTLLSLDNVEPVVGANSQPEVGNPDADEKADVASCTWRGEDGKTVSVTVAPQNHYDELGTEAGTTTPIPGLGDEAFSQVSSEAAAVVVRSGDYTLAVNLPGGTAADVPALTALAAVVVPSLEEPPEPDTGGVEEGSQEQVPG